MENNNGKGIFYGVIGVATLVVAIIGATFAYFAASTNGTNEAVATNAASVKGSLKITEGASYVAPDLIPADKATMIRSFGQTGDATANTGKCRGASATDDTANYGMCSYYTFTITNNASVSATVYLSLKTDANSFAKMGESEPKTQYLEYCVYEGTTTTGTVTQDCKAVPDTQEQFTSINLAKNGGTQTYTIVLYLRNDDDVDQTDAASGKAYTGTVLASTSDGTSQIVGYVAGA